MYISSKYQSPSLLVIAIGIGPAPSVDKDYMGRSSAPHKLRNLYLTVHKGSGNRKVIFILFSLVEIYIGLYVSLLHYSIFNN